MLKESPISPGMASSTSSDSKYLGKFQYSPLSDTELTVRLLRLLPGRRGTQIRINMSSYRFSPGTHPPYEALSYTWGNENDRVPITVWDGDYCWSLDVTRNCEEALQNLRYAKRDRVMWIDAICINQADELEKSNQVSNMLYVYRVAYRVIAWLGPADRDTHLAVDWIRTLHRNVGLKAATDELFLRPGGNKVYLTRTGPAIMSARQSQAFYNFASRSWFSRLWIWQEVRTQRSQAVLKCGGHQLKWECFRVATIYLSGKMKDWSLNWRDQDILLGLCNGAWLQSTDLLDQMRPTHCRDPRDRIYVAEALGGEPRPIQPDYSEDWKDVFTRWARERIKEGDLRFLEYSGHNSPTKGLPSWVPNWNERNTKPSLPAYSAALYAQAACRTIGPKQLRLSGFIVTELQDVHDFELDCLGSDPAIEDCLDRLRRLIKLGYAGNGNPETFTAFARTLNSGDFLERHIPRGRNNVSMGLLKSRLKTFIAKDTGDSSGLTGPELGRVMHFSRWYGRSFFKGKKGQYGLCSDLAKPGDVVAVIFGCHCPMILRPIRSNRYRVIGPAYCDGAVYGEAMLGELPKQFEYVRYWVGDNWIPACRNKNTRQVVFEDPRLPPLPPEWMNMTPKDRPFDLEYLNIHTGERRYGMSDPRCDVDALKKRGLNVQELTLV